VRGIEDGREERRKRRREGERGGRRGTYLSHFGQSLISIRK